MKIIGILLGFIITNSLFAQTDVFNHPLNNLDQKSFVQVEKQLAENLNLKGQFKQTRHIQALSEPLTSKGHFLISNQGCLQWIQTQPFASTMSVTDNKITQQMEGGPETILTKEKQPVIFSFTNIFMSVFTGKASTLKQYFDIYFTGDAEHWQIGLKPKNSPLNQAIDTIKLAGNQYIHTVTISETRGNKLIIEFYHIKPLKHADKQCQ